MKKKYMYYALFCCSVVSLVLTILDKPNPLQDITTVGILYLLITDKRNDKNDRKK